MRMKASPKTRGMKRFTSTIHNFAARAAADVKLFVAPKEKYHRSMGETMVAQTSTPMNSVRILGT